MILKHPNPRTSAIPLVGRALLSASTLLAGSITTLYAADHQSSIQPTTPLKGDMQDLSVAKQWKKLGHGVYSIKIGKADEELRYTDLQTAPAKWDTINQLADIPLTSALKNMTYRVSADGLVSVRIPTEPDEKIYGFGLQFDKLSQKGKVVELRVDHFGKGGGATHAPVPFYISSKGYGVYFNTAKFIKFYNEIGNRKDSKRLPLEVDRNPPKGVKTGHWYAQPPSDAVEAYIHGKGLEVIGFTGKDFQDIVARYNLFSGGGAMPPLWGLGFWYRTPSDYTAQQVNTDVTAFGKHKIPLDVVGLEPGWQSNSYPCTFEWQTKRFPDPAAFSQNLLKQGIRLNLWENPYVSKHSRIFKDLYPLSGSHTVWLGIVPDYTLPQAQEILVAQHKKDHFDIGISGYKIDEVDGFDRWLWPEHATFPSGTSAESMRQTYGMLWQKMVYEKLFHANNQRTYGLIRSSNGAASHSPFVIYSDSYKHQNYLTGMSSSSLCGILWSPEIRKAGSPREWINRMHTACFSPLAQLNAWASGTKPWEYPAASDAVKRTIELRMKLLPYLYTAFYQYNAAGIPPIRAMLLETGQVTAEGKTKKVKLDGVKNPYGDGEFVAAQEDNSMIMFGPDILMAPFIDEETTRTVQLPKGNWYSFYTGKLVGNGKKITVTAKELNNLPPLFVKEGAVIPMLKHSVLNTGQMKGADIELRHYGTKPGTCLLYEDDGTTFNYEKGQFRLRQFTTSSQKIEKTTLLKNAAPAFYGKVTFRQMGE